jgi:hypothetical protein
MSLRSQSAGPCLNILEEGVQIAYSDWVQEDTQPFSLGVRADYLYDVGMRQSLQYLYLFSVFLSNAAPKEGSFVRNFIALDSRLMNVTHCSPTEKTA